MASFKKITYQDGTSKWRAKVNIQEGNGKYRSIYKFGDSKREVQDWAAKEEARKLTEPKKFIDGGILFSDYIEFWWKETAVYRKEVRTNANYRCNIDKHIEPQLGHYRITSIDHDTCKNFQHYLIDQKLSNVTENRIMILLGQILSYASTGSGKKRKIESNPMDGIESLPVNDPGFNFWEIEDIKKFFNCPRVKKNHYHDVYLCAINSGMRMGEIAALTPEKIDLNKKQILVSNSLKYTPPGSTVIGDTKTHSSRVIPMGDILLAMFERRCEGLSKTDLIFTRPDGKKLDIGHFNRQFQSLQKKAKIGNIIKFHDLRDTYASHFMMNGGNIFTLQKLLGHTDIKTTMIYAHLSPDYLLDSRNIVQFKGVQW